MPTYDFRCPQGHEFERFYRTISAAAAELPCPECGATANRQLSGGAGLLFKGSGFYLTDYGKNAHRKRGHDSGAKADSKGEGKAESKPDAKEAAKAEGTTPDGGAKADKTTKAEKAESKPASKPATKPKSE